MQLIIMAQHSKMATRRIDYLRRTFDATVLFTE